MFVNHNVAKLLFLCKRARPDIKTAVAFLTTRVKAPDEDEYKKIGRVMKYLRGTISMKLTLEGNSLNSIKWWADGAFAIHPDMRSHTGGVMTLGTGAVYATSKRKNLNTKSSTEAELVAVDAIMPQVLWTTYFSNHKDTQLTMPLYTKIIKVQFYWKRMVGPPAVSDPAISM